MGWCRGRAYSQDLRDRVLAGVADGFSVARCSDQFQVSRPMWSRPGSGFIGRGRDRHDAQRSHTPRKLSEEHHAAIRARGERGTGRDDSRAAGLGGCGNTAFRSAWQACGRRWSV